MFVSANQFSYFTESVCIGIFFGVCYEFFGFVKIVVANKVLRQIVDFLFLPVAFFVYFKASEIFYFPNFRTYLFVGVSFGFFIYYLSFYKTLAKVLNLLYNKTISFIRRKNRDRKQKTKASVRSDGDGGNNKGEPNRRA